MLFFYNLSKLERFYLYFRTLHNFSHVVQMLKNNFNKKFDQILSKNP